MHALLMHISDSVVVTDSNFKITYINKQTESLYGYTAEELQGQHPVIFNAEPNVEEIQNRIYETLSAGNDYVGEALNRRKDGSTFICEYKISMVFDAEGNPYAYVGIQRDITERKRVEEKLRENEERYSLINNSSNDSIYSYDGCNGRFTSANRRLCNALGLEPHQIIGKTHAELGFPSDLCEEWAALHHKVYETNSTVIAETTAPEADGIMHVYEVILNPLHDSNGCILGIGGTTRDITERKQMEDRLRKSEEQLRSIMDNVTDVMWSISYPEMKILYLTPSVETIYGRPKEDFFKQESLWVDTIHDDDKNQIRESLEQLPQTIINQSEFRIVRPDGTIRWLRDKSKLIFDSSGQPVRIDGLLTDITDRKQVEEELRKSEEKYRYITENMTDVVWMTDLNLNTTYISPSIERLGGESVDAYLSQSIEQRFPEKYIDIIRATLQEELEKEKDPIQDKNRTKIIEAPFYRADKSLIWVEFHVAFTRDAYGKAIGIHGVTRDITSKKADQKEIEYLSFHDSLTELYNRRFFDEELKRLDVERNLPLTLIMLDVNGLKLINDAFGHALGDTLLRKVADVLQQVCRADDIIARIGGDEFAIILPKTHANEAHQLAKRISKTISYEKIEAVPISISCGWGTKVDKDESTDTVFKLAEDYMYRNKISDQSSRRYESIQLIMKTLFAKKPREQYHSNRVSCLCAKIGSWMGLSQAESNELATTGVLHDIGKIAINNNILNKTGSLSHPEWQEIRRHPEIGYSILSAVNDYARLAACVLNHHERWDGTGYPNGQKGEEIPLYARIMAIADAYDAMTSDRPYRKAMDQADALKELEICAGSQFDPAIVKAFMDMMREDANLDCVHKRVGSFRKSTI